MFRRYDEFTRTVVDYDPTTDVDEWWLHCSAGVVSCHRTIESVNTAQAKLEDAGISGWISYHLRFGPPGIEEQLDAARRDDVSRNQTH